jgi:IS4 transposase
MAKKRNKSKNYDITGIVEVYNITRGRRKATILNFDEPLITEIVEHSGSIVIKRAIYEANATKELSNQEIPPERPSDER